MQEANKVHGSHNNAAGSSSDAVSLQQPSYDDLMALPKV